MISTENAKHLINNFVAGTGLEPVTTTKSKW